jgi:geranylgeranyl pyrophosphate synthase
MSDDLVTEVLAILARCGAREHASAEAPRYRDRALALLDELPCPPERREDLERFVRSVIAA